MERLLTLYSEVQSTDVRWLWYPFIAIGKITLLQGDPGDGKSTMMMNLIAELSMGGRTPDGCKISAPQKVIYQCSEDGVSDTIKPRLERCGADCRKIAFINKVLGRVANSDQGLCMLFDLEEAIMFTPKPQEYADPLTGEMKKKQMKFFPDTYRNRIGKSYNDYIADHQMNMFEDFIGYQGSAVLDEPVREEDSFSKESMSQESEISENILLPDLVKQSESIEQQSGEIAERGMPT